MREKVTPKEAYEILSEMSSSPYNPEPPRKSLAVNFFMKLARLRGRTGYHTPHLFNGSDLSKVEWEYNQGSTFFKSINDYASIDILDNKDVLDVGCGWGGKMIYYAENSKLKTISGFDLPGVYKPEVSAKFAASKEIINCFFKTGYAENMPYNDNSFDIIIMEDVLEHVRDPEKVIEESYRVLRTGGTVIVKFPSFKMMYAHHLDRALVWPALHYMLPMKTWAAGLNYLLLNPANNLFYEPFSEVVSTKYCRSITKDLNGLDFSGFKEVVKNSKFRIRVSELNKIKVKSWKRKAVEGFCKVFFRIDVSEFLSSFVIFIGEKNG